ncbi:MAG: hypothetical protein V8S58_05250, partial [Lachnospiraceae bacterium]
MTNKYHIAYWNAVGAAGSPHAVYRGIHGTSAGW